MKTIIIGYGEVGQAHFKLLSKAYPKQVFYKDIGPDIRDDEHNIWHQNGTFFDLMLVATRCDPANMEPFYKDILEYQVKFRPKHIDILTTTPCGSCDELAESTKIPITKSSVRGMHPHLHNFMRDIPKHIGGPGAAELAKYYEAAGFPVVVHEKARTVEFAHKWNNITYGANIMIADECADDARREGVDFVEYMKYRETNNVGFIKAGFPSKVSPIIYPSNHHIGGHCVVYSATTIPEEHRGPITKLLVGYNNARKN